MVRASRKEAGNAAQLRSIDPRNAQRTARRGFANARHRKPVPELAMSTRNGPVRPPTRPGHAPIWMVVLLLSVATWLSARILHNVTAALTAMTTGTATTSVPPAWPERRAGDSGSL